MLEVFDQAHGLQAYAPMASVTRLLPVPAMVGGGMSHRLLWLMARRLALQGEQVCVIDGMADESPGQGLLQRLQDRDQDGDGPNRSGAGPLDLGEEAAPGVHILPGRQGMLRLANQAHGQGVDVVLQRLMSCLPEGTQALLTAPVEVLAVCLQGSLARPLVALDGQPRSVVEAYNAVKVLLQAGDLHPVLVPLHPLMPRGPGLGAPASVDAAVTALARCAQAHLGEVLPIWPVAYDESREWPGDRVPEAWLFKVLDSALMVSPVARPPMSSPTASVGSESDHWRC